MVELFLITILLIVGGFSTFAAGACFIDNNFRCCWGWTILPITCNIVVVAAIYSSFVAGIL